MKKKVLALSALTIAILAGATGLRAQSEVPDGSQFDTTFIDFDEINQSRPQWYRGGVGGVTMSQSTLSNWAAGGESQLAFDALLNYDANYHNRRHLWQNRLELAYGMSKDRSHGNRKANDKIFLSSMYGYRLSQQWYASALFVFSTQFAKGYDYTASPKRYKSRFMAPGYVGLGVGATWRPNSWFTAYMSPATWRMTVVNDGKLFQDNTGAMVYSPYGVEPGKKVRHEFGANVRLEINRDIIRNLHLYSRLDLFSNYLHKPQNVDVRWYMMLAYKINNWLGVNLNMTALYDDDIKFMSSDGTVGGSRLQFREVLGIGLQTTF